MLGPTITGTVSPLRFQLRNVLGLYRDWRRQINDLIEEAGKSNYLLVPRGAAICLRIVLESIINVKLLGKDPKNPDNFCNLSRAIDEARDKLEETAVKRIQFIKDLGDEAAHPRKNSAVLTSANVDKAMMELTCLLREVKVVS